LKSWCVFFVEWLPIVLNVSAQLLHPYRVSHIFLYLPGWRDLTLFLFTSSWLYHSYQIGSWIFLRASHSWSKVLNASSFGEGFVIAQANIWSEKYWLPNLEMIVRKSDPVLGLGNGSFIFCLAITSVVGQTFLC